MKKKIIPIVFLVFVLGISFIAFSRHSDKQKLTKEKQELVGKNQDLTNDLSSLQNRYRTLSKEKDQLKLRADSIQDELSRAEQDRDSWKSKWNDISRERDLLVEKLKEGPSQKVQVTSPRSSEGLSEDHWADFVAKKAALEAKIDGLDQILLDAKAKLSELDKNNKELSIKIDQLTKDKRRLEEQVRFKERTLRVMSMDLVSERGERAAAVTELRKLRSENIGLKREIVLANKEKIRLQNNLKETMTKKNLLENRISIAENIFKEKALAFDELKTQLATVITGPSEFGYTESAAVELPPIVVKPRTPSLRGLQGEIIAVNAEERFVVIDIGEGSGVRPGFLLKVMRGAREIATVEIIETRREISAADIKEIIGGYSIQEGDIVVGR